MQRAVILTHGRLESFYAKTCHGLLRGTERYNVVAVVDHVHAGKSTGDLLMNVKNVPVVRSVEECAPMKPEACVVGVAFDGGLLPDDFKGELSSALALGLDVVNGLHTLVGSDPGLVAIAERTGANIIDIRRPKTIDELHFWSGKIRDVRAPRLAVLGTDCAVGKRTTCRMLWDNLVREGKKAAMIYTGQTGWLQGYPYGCIVDATLNDFVCGELEHAVCECDRALSPEIILVEGQSALRNPSGPCGAEILVSLQTKYAILQHDPSRSDFEISERPGDYPMPTLSDEISLIEMYGAEVVAVVLNPADGMSQIVKHETELEVKIPVYWGIPDALAELSSLVIDKISD